MLDAFREHIEKFGLCSRSDLILLAVSGGIDSVTMFYLFTAAGYRVGLAHCNFQLRDKESDADEEFVVALAKAHNVPVYVRRFETEAYAWEKTLSTQMAARELRYQWFNELVQTHGYRRIATAHHFDDTMETILLNITRGTGLEGLTGIPVRNGDIIRPMLFCSRHDVERYALTNGIVWREDQSNATDDYQRNFIRHQIIPKLKELNPSLESSWKTGLEKAKDELALLHRSVEDWKAIFTIQRADRIEIKKEGLNRFNHPSLLWRYVRNFGFNYEQVKELMRALHGQPGKFFVSHTHRLVIDRDVLIVTERQQQIDQSVIDEGQEQASLGPWTLSMIRNQQKQIPTRADEAVIDADQIRYPITWRRWKPGDYFHPLGMNHRKKLSDLFIDMKLSMADKEDATVIESDGKIIWVVGYRIDDHFKLSAGTGDVITFKVWR